MFFAIVPANPAKPGRQEQARRKGTGRNEGTMRRFLIALGVSLTLGGSAIADAQLSTLLRSQSNLSPEYRALIRPPVPGSLAGQPRRPTRLETDEWAGIPIYSGASGVYQDMARVAARRHNVPEDLFLRLVRTESNFRPTAKSSKGAIGLAQLMPFTARHLGVNPHDPQENLEGGARYLSQQYRRFGNWRLALAAYNAGPEAVERYRGIPPYSETQRYVRAILGR
jgi:hypothetical protein